MYQAKVKQTEQYSDSQGEHVVCKGKFILVEEPNPKKRHSIWKNKNGQLLHTTTSTPEKLVAVKGIIISETEEIEIGDYFVKWKWEDAKPYIHLANKSNESMWNTNSRYYDSDEYTSYKAKKILALPEHFSDKHLQAIADGKMRDGDEVLVKCIPDYENPPKGYYTHYGSGKYYEDEPVIKKELLSNPDKPIPYLIYLNRQNHITLFPVKQSLEDAYRSYIKCISVGESFEIDYKNETIAKAFIAGAEWAKENNY